MAELILNNLSIANNEFNIYKTLEKYNIQFANFYDKLLYIAFEEDHFRMIENLLSINHLTIKFDTIIKSLGLSLLHRIIEKYTIDNDNLLNKDIYNLLKLYSKSINLSFSQIPDIDELLDLILSHLTNNSMLKHPKVTFETITIENCTPLMAAVMNNYRNLVIKLLPYTNFLSESESEENWTKVITFPLSKGFFEIMNLLITDTDCIFSSMIQMIIEEKTELDSDLIQEFINYYSVNRKKQPSKYDEEDFGQDYPKIQEIEDETNLRQSKDDIHEEDISLIG